MARLLIPFPQSVKMHRPLGKGRGVRESRRATPGALPLGGRNGGRKTGPQRPASSGNTTSCPRVRGSLRVVHTASPAVPRPQAPPDCSWLPNTQHIVLPDLCCLPPRFPLSTLSALPCFFLHLVNLNVETSLPSAPRVQYTPACQADEGTPSSGGPSRSVRPSSGSGPSVTVFCGGLCRSPQPGTSCCSQRVSLHRPSVLGH